MTIAASALTQGLRLAVVVQDRYCSAKPLRHLCMVCACTYMYAAVGGQQGQQRTVLVMTTPGQVVGEVPILTTCANCQNQIVTNIIYKTGGLTWFIVAILCFLGSVRG